MLIDQNIPLNFDELDITYQISLIAKFPHFVELIKNPNQDMIVSCLVKNYIDRKYINIVTDKESKNAILRYHFHIYTAIIDPIEDDLDYLFNISTTHFSSYNKQTFKFDHDCATVKAIRLFPNHLFRFENILDILSEDMIDEIIDKIDHELCAMIIYNFTKRDEIKTYLKMKFS